MLKGKDKVTKLFLVPQESLNKIKEIENNPVETEIRKLLEDNKISENIKLNKLYNLLLPKHMSAQIPLDPVIKKENETPLARRYLNFNPNESDISIKKHMSDQIDFTPQYSSSPMRNQRKELIFETPGSENVNEPENNIANSLANSEIDLSGEKNSFLNNLKKEAGTSKIKLNDLSFGSFTDDKSYVKVRNRRTDDTYFPDKPKSHKKYKKTVDEFSPRKTRLQRSNLPKKQNASSFLNKWIDYETIILKRKQVNDMLKQNINKRRLN